MSQKRSEEHSVSNPTLRHSENWDKFADKDLFWSLFTTPEKKGGKWTEEEFFQAGESTIQHLFRLLEAEGVPLCTVRALDFGCGAGRCTRALAGRFRETYGVDVSERMIEKANEYNRFPGKCHYHINQRSDLKLFEDNYFDLILSLLTLQHLEPGLQKAYIEEFVRTLRPGGIGLFQLPSFEKESGKLIRRVVREEGTRENDGQPVMELHGEDPKQIRKLVESCGGTLIRVLDSESAVWKNQFYIVGKNAREESSGGFPYEIIG